MNLALGTMKYSPIFGSFISHFTLHSRGQTFLLLLIQPFSFVIFEAGNRFSTIFIRYLKAFQRKLLLTTHVLKDPRPIFIVLIYLFICFFPKLLYSSSCMMLGKHFVLILIKTFTFLLARLCITGRNRQLLEVVR